MTAYGPLHALPDVGSRAPGSNDECIFNTIAGVAMTTTHRRAKHKSHRDAPRPPFERIALLLQGGGALGSYQAGVYQALAEANLHPDWVAGISIGSINSALIAGYQGVRPLSLDERAALPVLARGAAMRFLLTRAYDWLNTPADALVTRKDPLAFARRLTFYGAIENGGIFG